MSGPLGSSQWMYQAGEDYEIPYSCRFDRASDSYLQRQQTVAGDRRTWTFSTWFKRGALGSGLSLIGCTFSGGQNYVINFAVADDKIMYKGWEGNRATSVPLFRDPSAWYHIVIRWDTTQNTEADRVRIYVNGEQIELDEVGYGYPSLDMNTGSINMGSNYLAISGRYPYGIDNLIDGYLAEVHFVDGTALTPSSFGETGDYGEWKPIEVTGLTYGDEGFYLDFADSSALGNDVSGNDNDFTVSDIDASDQMLDTPTNNFATLNGLDPRHSGYTFAEGNLRAYRAASGWQPYFGTMVMTSGKWYWETYIKGGYNAEVGVVVDDYSSTDNMGHDTGAYCMYSPSNGTGYRYDNGVETYVYTFQGDYEWHWSTDVIVQVAYDADTGKLWFGKNNTWFSSGNPSAGSTPLITIGATDRGRVMPCNTGWDSATNHFLNFGQDSSFAGEKTAQGNTDTSDNASDFYYTPPTDFLALCTANMAEPAVKPSEHFNTVVYDDGAGAKTVGFQPDIVWLKSRGSSYEHELVDSVRGATKALSPDSNNVESTDSTGLTSFDSNGFTVGADNNYDDTTGDGMVAWCWKINSSGTTATNDTGSIDTEVTANTDAGMSMATFTGNETNSTIGHGLSKAPDLAVIRTRAGSGWAIYHSSLGGDYSLDWGTTGGKNDEAEMWQDTDSTSTVLTIGDTTYNNDSGEAHIAYFFHEVDGFSAFGKYTGNGSTDGPFNYCGFRPAYVVIKNEQNATPWMVFDSSRDTYNPATNYLVTYGTNTEASTPTANAIDFLANGFKLTEDHADMNDNNVVMYWWAFAETPFKYANAR